MNPDSSKPLKFDAGPPDMGNPYHDELTELRIDRLGQRVTLISFLLPLLIVVILALGYVDLKSRVAGLQDTGTARVEHLAENLESRFSSLSVRAAEIEQALSRRMADLEQGVSDLSTRIGPLTEALKRLEAGKADRGDVEKTAAGLEQKIAPLVQGLTEQQGALKTLKDHLEARAANLEGALEGVKNDRAALADGLSAVKNQVAALSKDLERTLKEHQMLEAQAARQQQIETELKALESALRRELETVRSLAQNRTETLEQRLERLAERVEQLRRSPAAAPGPGAPATPGRERVTSPSPPADTGPPVPVKPQPERVPDLKPGQIIEKPLN